MTTNNNHSNFPVPKVIIDRIALDKIRYLVNKDSQELSGMGITRIVGDTIYVDDVQMLEQRNGAVHTDIDAAAVSKLMYDWRERPGEINFWWHSHVNMGTFWSGTDIDTIKQLGQQGLCVASVFNKRGEIRTAVACKMHVPFAEKEQLVIFDEINLQFVSNTPDELKKQWDEEHAANVKKHTPRQPWMGHGTGTTGHHTTNGTSRFGVGADERIFFPVVTRHPDHWDTQEQAKNFDINWQGDCYLDFSISAPERGLYRKSTKHRLAEKEWLQTKNTILGLADRSEGGDVVPSTRRLPRLPSVTGDHRTDGVEGALKGVREINRGVKMKFAEGRDEITEYDPILDMFVLYNGSKIDAGFYMSKDGVDFRRTTVDLFVDKQLPADQKAELQKLETTLTQENIELEREMTAYERDLAIRDGIIHEEEEDEGERLVDEETWQKRGQLQ